MVKVLDAIIEEDIIARSTNKDHATSIQSLGETLAYFQQSLKKLEFCGPGCELFCEPESELDPLRPDDPLAFKTKSKTYEDATLKVKAKRSKRGRKSARFADTAQARELPNRQLQIVQSCMQDGRDPAHIWFSDLAADWSRYIAKPVTSRSLAARAAGEFMKDVGSCSVAKTHEGVTRKGATSLSLAVLLAGDSAEDIGSTSTVTSAEGVDQVVASTKRKRVRKKQKSLIDQAEAQQRKELWALHEALARAVQTKHI